MPGVIYLPVRAEVLDALRSLADGVASVATRDHGELTSELLMVAGRELVWLTVEPHDRSRDLSVEQLDALTLAGAELLAAAITHLAPRPAGPACPAAEVPSLGPPAQGDIHGSGAAGAEGSRWQRLPPQLRYVVEHFHNLTAPDGVRELTELQERVRRAAGMLILMGHKTAAHPFHRPATIDLYSRLDRPVLQRIPRDELLACANEWDGAIMHAFAPADIVTLRSKPSASAALHAAAAWLHAHPEQLAACEARPEHQ